MLWYPPVQDLHSAHSAQPEWLHTEMESSLKAARKRQADAEQDDNEQKVAHAGLGSEVRNLRTSNSRKIAGRLVQARGSIVSLGGLGGLMRDATGKRGSGQRRGSTLVVPPKPERYAAIRQAFNIVDVNHSNYISHREMLSAIKSLGEGKSSSAVSKTRQFISDADEDGDGYISFPEFRQAARQAACADLATQLTSSHLEDSSSRFVPRGGLLECFMDGTEAVIAAEHVMLYKYRMGELQLMASRTQESRVDTQPKLQVGEILDPVAYEKWLRTGKAVILEASRTDITHIGGKVASVLVVPIHAPGGRALGLLEFVNKAEAFDHAEKDAAVQLAAHLRRAFVQTSLWGAASCPLRGVHQLDHVVKITLDSREADFDFTGIGDALVDTCDVLQSERPDWQLYVLFLANIVDGERWDDRSKTNDSRVAAALAPLKNVLVVEVSIREEDWRAESQPFPLSHHPRWMLTHIPTLVHYRQERENLQELKLRKPNVFALDDFLRVTLAGGDISYRASDWSLPVPVKLDERASRADQHASLLFQLKSHNTSAEQLIKHKTSLDQDITALQQLIGVSALQSSQDMRLSLDRNCASFKLPNAPVPDQGDEAALALSFVGEGKLASATQNPRMAEDTGASLNSSLKSSSVTAASLNSSLKSPSVKAIVAMPSADEQLRPEHGWTADGRPASNSCKSSRNSRVPEQPTKPGKSEEGKFKPDVAIPQARIKQRRSSLQALASMAGSRMASSLSSWSEPSEYDCTELGVPRNHLTLYEEGG